MTWSVSASGHHSTNDWRAEEHELLRHFADACEADGGATITGSFSFNGNHVQASSLVQAHEKLAAYDAEGEAPAGSAAE
jgi:hypothetical protein